MSRNYRPNEASIIAQQMAYNTAQQYKLGDEDLQSQLMGDYPSQVQSDTVNVVNPGNSSRSSKQTSVVSAVSDNKNGYSAKEMTKSNIPVTKADPNLVKAKDFIAQTRALDNDLDHAIALFKLNNKDQFYKNGTTGRVEADLHKKIVREITAETQEEKALKKKVADLLKRFNKARKDYGKKSYVDEDEEARIDEIQQEYDNLNSILTELQAEQAANIQNAPKNEDILKGFVDQGKVIDVIRNDGHGKTGAINMMDDETYNSTRSEENSHLKSKKGVRVTSQTDVDRLSTELLLVSKKIANGINILIPLAQTMADTRYQGITHADKLMLQEMYQDMDEKLYILTSVNNVDNTIFVKLDKNYDKLYDTVKRGLDSYNGGSMLYDSYNSDGPGIRIPPAHSYVKCDNWKYL